MLPWKETSTPYVTPNNRSWLRWLVQCDAVRWTFFITHISYDVFSFWLSICDHDNRWTFFSAHGQCTCKRLFANGNWLSMIRIKTNSINICWRRALNGRIDYRQNTKRITFQNLFGWTQTMTIGDSFFLMAIVSYEHTAQTNRIFKTIIYYVNCNLCNKVHSDDRLNITRCIIKPERHINNAQI